MPAIAQLVKPVARHVKAGHPWLFDDAVRVDSDVTTGTVVDVLDLDGSYVGRGLYDAESPIAIRIWTTEDRPIDGALIRERVAEAFRAREELVEPPDTEAYRIIHGEADRMPAIVVDRYGPVAVIMLDSRSAGRLVPHVSSALLDVGADLEYIVIKDRPRGGGAGAVRVLAGGPPPDPLVIRSHGVLLHVDIARGHKTGLYLDQRENHRRVMDLSSERRVLNVFSYTGAFSIAAALGGASEVLSVDSAEPVIEAAKRNFHLNGLPPGDEGYRFEVADGFEFLDKHDRSWDLIILDPPSMAPSASARRAALGQYRRLNAAAIRHMERGAFLLSCSCSSHISEDDLERSIIRGARDMGRRVAIRDRFGAAADHPVRSWFPEGDYLHAVLLEVTARFSA